MSSNFRDLVFRDVTLHPEVVDRFRLIRLYVEGVEVTQAIQYYNSAAHLTDPADRAPNNSVTLISGKPAWVRVYVRSLLLNELTGVTGTLEVRRQELFAFYTTLGTLTPQPPGTVSALRNPDYATERSYDHKHAQLHHSGRHDVRTFAFDRPRKRAGWQHG